MAKTLVEDNFELCDEKVALLKTTEILASSLKEACEEGRKAVVKGSPEHFLEDGTLGWKICKAYETAFNSLNVLKRTAFDKLFQKYYACTEVQDSFTNLTEVEDEWDQFLVDCDRTWQSPWDYCQVKRRRIKRLGPLDVKLTDARSGRQKTLASYLEGCTSVVLVLLRHFA
ncbi:hypothetical protein HOLleu_07386 [Holothuria leucospilota]|uniref:Uncharacterized protein n=1 Tax=Holothuria leucospilota TaxID=206669 RepID=A0A9Q1CGM6_HOLLE|nr:hypothetical protein HOLleu_07386 [Holothuria leucospilota]